MGRSGGAGSRAQQGWQLPAHRPLPRTGSRQRHESELVATTARLNNALKRFGSGWALFVEAERRAASGYPASTFPDALSWLVDEERRGAFEAAGSHFESNYFLTMTSLPPAETPGACRSLLLETEDKSGVDWREQLARFITETDRFLTLFGGVMPEIGWLSRRRDSDLSARDGVESAPPGRRARSCRSIWMRLLADQPLTAGLAPLLGDQHLRVVTVRGFPTSTWPGLLDELNRLGFAYRWMTRFLFLDKAEAERELVRLRRQWFAKRKGIVALLRETIFQQESPLVDSDAANKAADADAALQELGSDEVAYGYVTATVVVMDASAAAAEEKRKRSSGSSKVAVSSPSPRRFNAVEAWLSSIPGHVYANVRQPIISTLNLAHLHAALGGVGGPESQCASGRTTAHRDPHRRARHRFAWSPMSAMSATRLIVGPTGVGKSVLLAHAGAAVSSLSGRQDLRLRQGWIGARHDPGLRRRALRPRRRGCDCLSAAGAHR